MHSEAATTKPSSSPPLSHAAAPSAASPSVSTPPARISMPATATAGQLKTQRDTLGVPPRSPAPRQAKRTAKTNLLKVKRVHADPPDEIAHTKADTAEAPTPISPPATAPGAEKPEQSSAAVQLLRQHSFIDLTK